MDNADQGFFFRVLSCKKEKKGAGLDQVKQIASSSKTYCDEFGGWNDSFLRFSGPAIGITAPWDPLRPSNLVAMAAHGLHVARHVHAPGYAFGKVPRVASGESPNTCKEQGHRPMQVRSKAG